MTTPPRRYALIASGVYLAVTCLYMSVSTLVVQRLANGSVERASELTMIKGCAFMLTTAIAFYATLRWVAKKTERSAQQVRESQERWMEAERQAAPALLASVIAHDVANLLTVIRLNVEKIKRVPEVPAPAIEVIGKLDSSSQRLMELVKRLRGASTSLFNENPQTFDFTSSVAETLALMQSHVCCEHTAMTFDGDKDVSLRGYPVLVHQLVMNLMINAAEATERRGRVRFAVRSLTGGVELTVEDDGPGIEPSLREKVLGAFFTTKSTGTGLGLTSVRSCVEIHRGTMEISDSAELGGARFVIRLPNLSDARVEELRHPNRAKLTQGHWKAVPDADVPIAPVDSMRT